MSYNIQVGVAAARNLGSHPDLMGLTGIAEVIASQNPDVVCLQEVDRFRNRSKGMDQSQWLAEKLGYHHAFGVAFRSVESDGSEGGYGNAILSRFPLKKFQVIELDHGIKSEAWIEPRSCFLATLDTPVEVNVVGLHLSTKAHERVKPFSQLGEIIADHANRPFVMMGDFNAEHQELKENGMHDTLRNVFEDSVTPTFPNGDQAKVAIDHMLISTHFDIGAAWVVSERLGRSDHNPIVADLELASSSDQ